jgi:hypothetical protein
VSRPRSASRASCTTIRSANCRSSGPACAPTRGSRQPSSKR